MALQFIDGFDHYFVSNDAGFLGNQAATLQKWDAAFLGQMSPENATGRFGGNAMAVTGSGGEGWIQKNLPTPRDEMIVGFAFKSQTAHQAEMRFGLVSGGWIEIQLDFAGGVINAVNDDASVSVVSANILSENVWAYIEFKVKVHATAGTVEVRKNTTPVITLASHDTGTTGDTITNIRLRATSNLQTAHADDLYVADTTGAVNNDFLGDCRVDLLYTNEDGATNDFTLTSDDISHVANWQTVAKAPDITRDRDHHYVESGLIGAREDYGNDTYTENPTTIHGVQVVNNARKTSTGVLKYRDEMTIAGVQYDKGTDQTASTGDYHMSTFIRDTDPSDGLVWTTAKVNTVGSGFVITVREV